MKVPRQIILSQRGKLYLLVGFIVFYAFAVLLHTEYYPLNGEEPRRALVALEMRNSGNFIRPTTLGWEYYNKPPLYNWLISASMFLTGTESELAIRLPALIFILLWAIVNFFLLRNFMPVKVAALSSVFLLTSLDIFLWGLSNGGEMDIFYSFIVYLQVMSIYIFNRQQKWLSLFLASYFLCALGLLTKGFPSILFQGLTLLALVVFNRSVRVLFRWQHLSGILLFFAITGSYFYIYNFYGDAGRMIINLLKESFNKSAFGLYPERILRKMIEYPLNFFKILLPWSLLLLFLVKRNGYSLWRNEITRFSILFILFNLPVYWFTGQPKMRYVYMFIPFCMIILSTIFYHYKAVYPGLVNKILSFLPLIFLAALAMLIILPVLVSVDLTWWLLTLLLLLTYLFFAGRMKAYSIWYFAGGIVALRFIAAAVYLPAWYENLDLKYDREMERVAALNNNGPMHIYSQPDTIELDFDLKVRRFSYGSVKTLPFLTYQVPYYYYRCTGQLVTYDTTMRSGLCYMSLESSLQEKRVDTLYAYNDRNHGGQRILFFRVP
jgi:4-amino-4-deoxy-L-arabinose transferase-like glycosyltransferase